MVLKHVLVLFSALMLAAGCSASGVEGELSPATKTTGKVHPDLVNLFHDRPVRSNLTIIEGRVVIEAIAAGDPQALVEDLDALGARHLKQYASYVSCQLPIAPRYSPSA